MATELIPWLSGFALKSLSPTGLLVLTQRTAPRRPDTTLQQSKEPTKTVGSLPLLLSSIVSAQSFHMREITGGIINDLISQIGQVDSPLKNAVDGSTPAHVLVVIFIDEMNIVVARAFVQPQRPRSCIERT